MTKEKEQAVKIYAKGLELYRAGRFKDAAEVSGSALEIDPTDGPSIALKERCDEYQKTPPDNWSGVYKLTSK
ncbi:MAG: hypothetical protein E4H09_00595 [Spirochaetales bacterium]|nr:MAG: hypothetical protein E4H09_00595 [Spirochaetales bacterium]